MFAQMAMRLIFCSKSNGFLTHGVQRTTHHTLTSACLHEGLVARRNQTKNTHFYQFAVSQHWPQKSTKQCVNSHTATATWLQLLQQKLFFIQNIFETKCYRKMKNKDTKLYVVAGVVSCNDQSPSQSESLAKNYNKTGNKIQWFGRT